MLLFFKPPINVFPEYLMPSQVGSAMQESHYFRYNADNLA